jgi:plasmid replication initiation protein
MAVKMVKAKKIVYDEPNPSGRMMTMSNALTIAAHNLTLGEKRIVMYAIAQLHSKIKPKIDESPMVTLRVEEFAEMFEIDVDTAYTHMKDAVKKLKSRSITFYDPNSVRKGKAMKVTSMVWVAEYTYHDGEGWAEIHIWKNLVPHLMGLRRNFTQVQLSQAAALRSVYSWKLLEMLMRFKDTGWARYTIEDFCTSMGATPKQRENFNNIKRRIIEPAVKELTEKDNWLIEWHPIKAGRKVTSLHFTFKRNPQPDLFAEPQP